MVRPTRFNDIVDAAAGNPVLVRLLDQTRVFSWPERRALLVERVAADATFGLDRYTSHRQLVRALRARDSTAAEALVIEDARGGLGDLLAPTSAQDQGVADDDVAATRTS